ncbi:DNA helicase/exodeoxyribonuclease V, subunit B [Nitratireductor aquibiodomus]|uniref:DNA helicase/exodeoxyribonuclease V, subunit B n=1 Tax=Nitratireductor aquibiodomus TaxID=204799 RepID=A0A1H4KPF9_9HYPH|nr:double-strand break repair protein AddB [Nitratireductor aquibiodomus]SEB60371.1 DNA helicase/exodeoxyribonuclease V, subunit B [Nitratireductor aquibiodomus]
MPAKEKRCVFSIPPGVGFLETLVEALFEGRLVSGFRHTGDPLTLADVTIYLPTRRAARALRDVLLRKLDGQSAILPVIRPLGEFDEEAALFDTEGASALDHAPPIEALDRILLLAPLVQAWKARLPGHVAALFEEGVVVPASASDSIWLARDLAGLMDEIETEEADWTKLASLAPDALAHWWQVTLEFLQIVTAHWPKLLEELDRSNPAAHRNAMLAAEAARLKAHAHKGPVIAAGSTGSIPATARLLATIAGLENGAVVLPGLDTRLDARAWEAVGDADEPSAFGHPQAGLKKLLSAIGITREEVVELGEPAPPLALRRALVSETLRPAETTDAWLENQALAADATEGDALSGVTLVETANEREEALSIAVALRLALTDENATAALVTPDRGLARRVAVELRRFGIEADDSGGTPLTDTPPATFARLLLETVFRPGEPIAMVALLKHPMLRLGLKRASVRRAAETIELVALRGGTGRPDIATLDALFETRWEAIERDTRKPFWFPRVNDAALAEARAVLGALVEALRPLAALRGQSGIGMPEMARATVEVLEALGRSEDGSLTNYYDGERGQAMAAFLRGLVGSQTTLPFDAGEWPAVFAALIATEVVKPTMGADRRVAIWGTLEARLLHVDTMVLGGMNEGTWPAIPSSDRFMSRLMKAELSLEPPERRIGQAAHDFMMAMGTKNVVLTRAARAGDAPAVASRWLQRLTAFAGKDVAETMRARGRELIAWARLLDDRPDEDFAPRPEPAPPVEARPTRFSITEIETLRRDPYAVYAKRILALVALDPLIRDPGAAERGNLFHDVLERFIKEVEDPTAPDALDRLIAIGRELFAEAGLPQDVATVWWPRFERTAASVIEWERGRAEGIARRHAEIRASATEVAKLGLTLSGRADRIDIRADGSAEILDYKTGASPSRRQAHTLLSPQLALEAALLQRGAFADIGPAEPGDLAYVRLKANGEVVPESILRMKDSDKTAPGMAEEAWERLGQLLAHYHKPETGYRSRVLPFREGDVDGDYDHLARVLEWSAGGDAGEGGGDE